MSGNSRVSMRDIARLNDQFMAYTRHQTPILSHVSSLHAASGSSSATRPISLAHPHSSGDGASRPVSLRPTAGLSSLVKAAVAAEKAGGVRSPSVTGRGAEDRAGEDAIGVLGSPSNNINNNKEDWGNLNNNNNSNSNNTTTTVASVAKLAALGQRFKSNALRNVRSKTYVRMASEDTLAPPIGIPVRELLVQIFNHKRDVAMRDFLIYFLYVLVFVAVLMQVNPTKETYSANSVVYQLFLDQEMPGYTYRKTFFDIGEFSELADWVSGPLAESLYPTTWYNGAAMTPSEQQRLQNYMQVVQGARIWLVRVSNNSCSMLQKTADYRQRFEETAGECFGPINDADVEQSPFGPPDDPQKYTFSSNIGSEIYGKDGWGEPDGYGVGGYAIFLPSDAANGTEILDQLVADQFFDSRMRAVAVDINLYNSNTNMLTVARFIVEFLSTGAFVQSYWIYSFRLLLYTTPSDIARGFGEVIIVLGCLYYIYREVQQMRRARPWHRYFTDLANVFDLLLQGLILLSIGLWIKHVWSPKRSAFNITEPCDAVVPAVPNAYGAATCFTDMFAYASNYALFLTFSGVIGLLMSLKFFKFFALSRKMNALWLTLAKAAEALTVFCFGFSLLVAGFAFMGQMCFGPTVADFHTFESSFSTLLRYPLGDFNYRLIADARPAVAPFFFVLYMGLVFLVCMNMVVAIITIAFEQVTAGLQVEEKWKHATSSYLVYIVKRARWVWLNFALYASLVCCRQCRSPQAAAAQEQHASVESRFVKDPSEAEIVALNAEAAFVRAIADFITAAERNIPGHDLLSHLEDIYRATPAGKSVYLGLEELCMMCRDADAHVDPFCCDEVGHKWRALAPFVVSRANKAREEGVDLSAQGVIGSALSCCRTRCCMRRTADSDFNDIEMTSQSSARPGRSWTRNPLRDSSKLDLNVLTPEVIKKIYKPKCVAWKMAQAYNEFKDVIMLGNTERHAFTSAKDVAAVAGIIAASNDQEERGGHDGTQPARNNLLGVWHVTKVNRGEARQKRIISLRSETSGVLLYNHDNQQRLRKRIPLSMIAQVEASVVSPFRAFLYMEPEPVSAHVMEVNAVAQKWTLRADTVYDLIFATPSQRDEFINLIIRLRKDDANTPTEQSHGQLGQVPRRSVAQGGDAQGGSQMEAINPLRRMGQSAGTVLRDKRADTSSAFGGPSVQLPAREEEEEEEPLTFRQTSLETYDKLSAPGPIRQQEEKKQIPVSPMHPTSAAVELSAADNAQGDSGGGLRRGSMVGNAMRRATLRVVLGK